jgi:hypothetical protein
MGELDWIDLAQDMYSACDLGNEISGPIKCWETTELLASRAGLSSTAQLQRVSLLVYC